MKLSERQRALLRAVRAEEIHTEDSRWIELFEGEVRTAKSLSKRGIVDISEDGNDIRLTAAGRALADKMMEEYQR